MDERGSHVEGPMTLVLRAMVERSESVVEVLQRAWGPVGLSVGGLRREDFQFLEVIFRRSGLREGEIRLFDRA
jgi:biotin synthase-related radical SAM superfamily protein